MSQESSAASFTEVDDDAVAVENATGQEETRTFADFGVSEEVTRALADEGIIHPFPIQALTLPVALDRHDIIGQAKTGTGKTLGFGIPMLENTIGPGEEGWEKIPEKNQGLPQGLAILPTRELAKQVANELRMAAAHRSVRIVDIYGGRAYEPQQEALRRGAEIVVGTPGRIIDLMRHGSLRLDHVKTLVLDEADEMLDLGFLEDVETILSRVPERRHTMLFSATMPGPVISMARRYMSKPTHIRASAPGDDTHTVKNIRQIVYRAHALNKDEVIARILQARGRGRTLIFTRTKRSAARLAEDLERRGFATGALHGDLGQGAREQALHAFRNGKVDVLVATDVAARGIDVDDVTHVINYQCPEDEKIYVHRIGRTGRAGNKGTAVTFVDWDDVTRWKMIDKQLGLGMPEPVETYHTSEHLYSDLDLPEAAGPRLPASQRTAAGLDAEEVEDLEGPHKRRNAKGSRHGARAKGSRSGHSGRASSGRASSGKTRSRAGSPKRSSRAGESRDSKRSEPRAARRTASENTGGHKAKTSGAKGQSGQTRNAKAQGTKSGAPTRRRRRLSFDDI